MRLAPIRLVAIGLAAALALAAPQAGAGGGGGGGVRVDPGFPPLGNLGNPGWSGGGDFGRAPRARAPATVVPGRPRVVCDAYGRCGRQLPSYGYGYGGYGDGYRAPLGTRPPGWADDLPFRGQSADRFVRPRSGVVCDRSTSVCYRRGEIDKSETRAAFGDRAADRADDLRDDRGTPRLFVPERGVTCDAGRQVCFDDGRPDFSLTRRYFGQRAAGRID